jgi:hypothetical protein
MNPRQRLRNAGRSAAIVLMTVALASVASAEWKEKVLYSFQGGSDGQSPAGGVVFDKAGNLYGATYEGGSTCPSPGCGTMFQLSPGNGGTWTETILYGFNGNQGSRPEGGVIADKSGNLYGTTAYGGSGTCILLGGNVGCGVAYELSPPAQKGGQWTYTILYSFKGGKDGQIPQGDLTLDEAGNIYGATLYGGGYGSCNAPYFQHCGTVFKLSVPKQKGGKWSEKILCSFKGGTAGKEFGDGANPNGGLVLDSTGAVYGTTYYGGNEVGECDGGVGGVGCGTVFKLSQPTKKGKGWSKSILRRFNGQDGARPLAGVILDDANDLYGTTVGGGDYGSGVAFDLKPPSGKSHAWTETVLYKFTDGADGANPMAGLIFDARGNLYGTADSGGGESEHGVVFELKPPDGKRRPWTFSLVYGFGNGANGWAPAASLILDKAGSLYSTTQAGGVGTGCNNGCGTVFEVSP